MAITQDELNRLKALCEKATPGPWWWRDWTWEWGSNLVEPDTGNTLEGRPVPRERDDFCPREYGPCVLSVEDEVSSEDKDFIAAARTALPELIAEVERLNHVIENIKALVGEPIPDIQTETSTTYSADMKGGEE